MQMPAFSSLLKLLYQFFKYTPAMTAYSKFCDFSHFIFNLPVFPSFTSFLAKEINFCPFFSAQISPLTCTFPDGYTEYTTQWQVWDFQYVLAAKYLFPHFLTFFKSDQSRALFSGQKTQLSVSNLLIPTSLLASWCLKACDICFTHCTRISSSQNPKGLWGKKPQCSASQGPNLQ